MDVFIICIVGGLVGALIGKCKGQPIAGFIVGAILGPIGWLLMALSKDARNQCPFCKKAVVKGATKCCHCGSVVSLHGVGSPKSEGEFDVQAYERAKRKHDIINEL